jgi:hypothetical protein
MPRFHTHHTYIARFSSPLLLPFSTPPPSPLPSLSAQGAFSSRRRRLLHSVVHSFFFSPSFSLLLFLSFFFSPSDTITLSRRYFSLFSCNKTIFQLSLRQRAARRCGGPDQVGPIFVSTSPTLAEWSRRMEL